MGIRYYAYPVATEFIEQARDDPYLFLSHDPLRDAWGPEDERPPMLYLDKCWTELQHLTGPVDYADPRPAFRLVEGAVTFTEGGWYAWTRVLDPAEVSEVARDLVLLDDDDIEKMIINHPQFSGRDANFGYIRQYLTDAQTFVTGLAKRGSGLVYMIG